MKILLDENLDVELKAHLAAYETFTVQDMGWLGKKNGELMTLIAASAFDIFVTGDKNLPFQQNLSKLTTGLCILDLPTNDIFTLRRFVPTLLEEIERFVGKPAPRTLKYISVPGLSRGKKLKNP
ncbi:MAG: hypothetical protein LH606_07385 [Cytophagaceae bacterium]|nr:hypothetical protein [Cytophagaceae bacterium]